MKILLTGKTGQLGQAFLNQASNFKFDVRGYTKRKLNITNASKIDEYVKKIKPQIIINTAAYHVLSECEKSPRKAFEVNAYALKDLATICKKNNIMLITFSTELIFDGLKGSAYNEDDKPNPLMIYGVSKLAGELFALNYNSKTLVIRTTGLYGGLHGSRSKKGNFVLKILSEAKKTQDIKISSEQTISPTYTEDLAESVLKLIRKNPQSGVYHLTNSGQCSWAQFAQAIVKNYDLKLKIIPYNKGGIIEGYKKPLFAVLENKKAKRLGVYLPTWEDGLKRYLSFLKENMVF